MMFCLKEEVDPLETTQFCPRPIYTAFECKQFWAVQLHNSIMEDRNVQEEGVALENLSFCNVDLMRHNNVVDCCHITGPVAHVPLSCGGEAALPIRPQHHPSDLLCLQLKSQKQQIDSSIWFAKQHICSVRIVYCSIYKTIDSFSLRSSHDESLVFCVNSKNSSKTRRDDDAHFKLTSITSNNISLVNWKSFEYNCFLIIILIHTIT